ncbi:uncharacterized protein METZ01_LOCUS285394 [marine metagenome]|uniref:Uncharacterized protein n=1 Tax=marine metagenome TaxID=408172 RepID=A0A382L7A5_9ZZZZ
MQGATPKNPQPVISRTLISACILVTRNGFQKRFDEG